ncbi:MAG: FecR domain-containing protein, partial [Bacteroidota bacterium]
MKDFSLFEIADFVMDEDFICWVNGKSKADDNFWKNWLKNNPNKHLMVAEARRILESIGSAQSVVAPEVIDIEIERLLQAINTQSLPAQSEELQPESLQPEPFVELIPAHKLSRAWWKYAAAAILLISILGGSAWLFTRNKKATEQFTYAAATSSRQLIENVNTSKNTITVPLPDGSTVKLASNSRISYEDKFDSLPTRDVYLSGQAFFNVKKNPNHPFRVFANEIVTKVLGTSFTIRAFEKDTIIQVTVNSGSVSVYSQGQTTVKELAAPNKLSGIIVTPNQQLVYERSSQEFQKILLENPVMINAVSANKNIV